MHIRTFLYSADADATVSADAPIAEVAPVTEAAPESEPAAEVTAEAAAEPVREEGADVVASSDPWSGELEQIEALPWYTALPEDARAAVRDGLKAKHATWESGYGKKFEEAASLRKAADADVRALKEAHAAEVKRLKDDAALLADLFGNEDGKAAQEHFEAKLAEIEERHKSERAALDSELGELRGYRQAAEKAAKEAYEAAVSKEAERMRGAYADILANDAAAEKLERLIAAGEDEADAVAYVRERFLPKAPKTPAAALNATPGDGPHAATGMPQGLSLDEKIRWAVDHAATQLGHR